MKKRDNTVYLRDMLDAIRQIEIYVQDISYDAFCKDIMRQDAVVRRLEIIGEASRNVSEAFLAEHPEIPWQDMIGMRHKIAHDYFEVDLSTVWDTVKTDLPALNARISRILNGDLTSQNARSLLMSNKPDFSISAAVDRAFAEHPIVDIHTHLYPLQMGALSLWGPDELVTYHYLKAETSRQLPPDISVEQFNAMPKPEQADVVWKTLFVGDSSPISEAQLGVITVMNALGIAPRPNGLAEFRAYCADVKPEAFVDLVFEKSGVGKVYMTNDPLDDAERPLWENGFDLDPRFGAVLRLDSALMGWPGPVAKLQALGYNVEDALSQKTVSEMRRYLNDWCDRIGARYMAISLPPNFTYPGGDPVSQLMAKAVWPTAQERNIPSAMMVGVKRGVNPVLRDGGDGMGMWDLANLENIARDFPGVDFLITILSRENQHGLCVIARKFPNILPFGCWWFLNDPSIIQEITAERLELLGASFIPQHSDARILDQLLYKWTHSVRTITPVFVRKYEDLANAGWPLTEADIKRDIAKMFGGGKLLSD